MAFPFTFPSNGAVSIPGAEDVVGNFSVATNKLTVAAATGNTAIAGDVAIATNKFTVAAASGNTVIAGTAAITGNLSTGANVGTVGTGSTVVEYGSGYMHTSVITVNTTLPSIAGGAALGVGKLLYTLPAGAQIIDGSYMSLAITQTTGHINANTPVVGLGTVIASGVISVLSGTGTFQDILSGQTAANCTGTATVKTLIPTANVPFVTAAAGAKTVHANVAATWAASGDPGALLVGTVVLNWRFMA